MKLKLAGYFLGQMLYHPLFFKKTGVALGYNNSYVASLLLCYLSKISLNIEVLF